MKNLIADASPFVSEKPPIRHPDGGNAARPPASDSPWDSPSDSTPHTSCRILCGVPLLVPVRTDPQLLALGPG